MVLTACTKDTGLTTPAPEAGKLEGKANKSHLNKAVAAVRQATLPYLDPEAALADPTALSIPRIAYPWSPRCWSKR